ncbi:MAG TPA: hypothetical protein PKH39_17230, partial [Woeseiaceae bacterium]|nr:hypothetical protein [Woeseiaceae bacterium]
PPPPPPPWGGLPLTQTTLQVTVTLPPGAVPNVGDLSLRNVIGETAVPADGAVSLETFAEGPLYAQAVDANGEVVLMSFVESDANTIDVDSTATAILFFASGAFALPIESTESALEVLAGRTETAELSSLLAARFAAGDATLMAAAAVLAPDIDRIARSLFEDPAQALVSREVGQKVTIAPGPTDAQSGIVISSEIDQQITLTNNFRRRTTAFYRSRGYVPQNSNVFTATDGPWMQERMAPRSGFTSVFDAVIDLLRFRSPFAPSVTNLDVPITPESATATSYDIIVIGPGFTFGEAFAELTEEQLAELQTLFARTLLFDFALPLIANVALPVGSDALRRVVEDDQIVEALTGAVAILSSEAAGLDLRERILAGELAGLGRDAVVIVIENSELKNLLYEALAETLVEVGEGAIAVPAEALTSWLMVAEAAGTGIDSVVQMSAWARSNMAGKWRVDVDRPNVSLDPEFSQLILATDPAPTVDLTVTVEEPPPEGQQYAYTWIVEGGTGHLSTDMETTTDTDLIAAGTVPNALFTADAGVEGVDDVLVEVTYGSGAETVLVGRAQATVEVVEFAPRLQPDNPSVRPGEETNAMRVTFPGPAEDWPTPLYYRWSSDEEHGFMMDVPNGAATLSDSTRYAANESVEAPQIEAIYVDVFTVDSARIGRATAEVTIEEQPSSTLGSLVVHTAIYEQAGSTLYAVCAIVQVTAVPDAVTYNLRATDGFDPDFYGSEININGPLDTSNAGCRIDEGEYPDGFFSLSGAFGGGADGAAGAEAWMHSRFDDFTWTVEVGY